MALLRVFAAVTTMGMTGENASRYRSIFLSPEWAHQRYYGWAVAREVPGLRLLQRRRGPLTKNLLLLSKEGRDHVEPVLSGAVTQKQLNDIVIHDFDRVLGERPAVRGLRLRQAADQERLLNVATIVIDLTADEHRLSAGMSSNHRREIRRAEADGVQVEAYDQPTEMLLERFTAALGELARTRGFDTPKTDAIKRMFAAGDSLLLVASRQHKDLAYVHLYTVQRLAYFMSGVTLSRANDGAGKLIHWYAMRHLKAHGYDWYDLGGVRSQRPDDGIYNFKRRFGGQFVSLGVEWRHAPILVRVAAGSHGALRGLVGHSTNRRASSSGRAG